MSKRNGGLDARAKVALATAAALVLLWGAAAAVQQRDFNAEAQGRGDAQRLSGSPLCVSPLLRDAALNGTAPTPHELAVRSLAGDAAASLELARRLDRGSGVARDPAEAAHWYEIAEEQGAVLPPDVLARLFP